MRTVDRPGASAGLQAAAQPAAQPAEGALPLAARRPRAILLVVLVYLAVTLSLYSRSVTHEEGRRAIVAQEMIFHGDLLAPTVFERPYFRKPPLHNWLIAATALPGGIVGERGARAVSLAALLALGVAVYALTRREQPESAAAATLMTVTAYLFACEYGNLAEPDMLLALFGVLAYFFYAGSAGKPGRLLASSLFMGLGILTKGVLPFFFYPGLLVRALADGRTGATARAAPASRGREVGRLAVHLLLALVLPLAWAAALWSRGDLDALLSTSASEIGARVGRDALAFLGHVISFPVRLAFVLLPWSAAVACAWRRGPRRTALYRDSLWIALVSIAFLTLASGARDRYAMPALPFLAVVGAHHFDAARLVPRLLSRAFLACLALACLVGAVAGAVLGYLPQTAVLLAATVVVVVLLPRTFAWLDLGLVAALVMVTAFEHAIYFYRAAHDTRYEAFVAAAGERVSPDVPLVIDEAAHLVHLGFYLEAGLGRPLRARGLASTERHYLVALAARPDTTGRVLVQMPNPEREDEEILLEDVPARR